MIDVVVVAGGKGSRFGGKKQWVYLKGKPLVGYSLEVFEYHPLVKNIYLGVPQEDLAKAKEILSIYAPNKGRSVYVGGVERYETVKNAFPFLQSPFVAIHDAVRPFVKPDVLSKLYEALVNSEAWGCIPVVPVVDTIKEVDDGAVVKTIDRSRLRAVQTPQLFHTERLMSSYEKIEDFTGVTDDAAVVERAGGMVITAVGDPNNFKITTKEDLKKAEKLLSSPRVGFGYDIHRIVEGDVIYLGGVAIPAGFSLKGHSDADVFDTRGCRCPFGCGLFRGYRGVVSGYR